MNFFEVWNSLDYIDGILFSFWIGTMYYVKCWIDNKFREKK